MLLIFRIYVAVFALGVLGCAGSPKRDDDQLLFPEMDQRLSKLELLEQGAQLARIAERLNEIENRSEKLATRLSDRIESTQAHQEPAKEDDPVLLFHQANRSFKSGQYFNSEKDFRSLLEFKLDPALAAAAAYGLAESLELRGELRLALVEYGEILNRFESSSYVPEALMKLSLIYRNMGNQAESSRFRDLLLSKFGKSRAAHLIARMELKP